MPAGSVFSDQRCLQPVLDANACRTGTHIDWPAHRLNRDRFASHPLEEAHHVAETDTTPDLRGEVLDE